MNKLLKYLKPRNYINKLKWYKVFRNTTNSLIGRASKIHSSAIIVNSKVGNNVTINENVTVNDCVIGDECKILSSSYFHNTKMGDYSYVNMNSFILRAKIGKFCSIASQVYIGPGSHPMDYITTHPFTFLKDYGRFILSDNQEIKKSRNKRSIEIGNDVWIGQGVLIMEDVKIGDGAIIGAHAVVTKDVEPYAIVVGTPAKKVRYRFEKDVINALLQIKWWDWERSKILENTDNFKHIEKFIKIHG